MYLLSAYLFLSVLLQEALAVVIPCPPYSPCSSEAIPYPTLFGAEVLSLSAAEVTNFSIKTSGPNFFAANLTNLNFCNVTLSYTHPGQNDTINVQVWLPLDGWNSRFMGTGGGGYATGLYDASSLAQAVALGYAAVATDGGHPPDPRSAASWALVSPGKVNLYLLQNFASVALHDMTVLGKAVATSYYGVLPSYSYWSGCSTGGRQGLMLAQRYPEDYDGILATAPAINWPSFIVAEYWPQQVMNRLGTYPPRCEFEAITAAAIEACDELDGLVDRIVAAPGLCNFDPHTIVGQSFNCNGLPMQISSEAATIALAAWTGPRTTTGSFEWYGLNRDASLAGLVGTTCTANLTCTGAPFPIASDWINLFVAKGDPTFDITNMTYSQYDRIFHTSNQQYQSIIGTNDPDLSAFRDAGGKMITWHGLADQLIPPNGTVQYYQQVLALDPNAESYYRYFEAPGVAHCNGGPGPFPGTAFDSLVQWVEQGVVPEVLNATTLPDENGTVREQPLCPYPLVSAHSGGDPTEASSFACAPGFA